MLKQATKCLLHMVGVLRRVADLPDSTKARLGNGVFLEFAPEDFLNGLFWPAKLRFLAGQPCISDGTVEECPFLQLLTPVFVRAAAEAVLAAPIEILGNGLQAERVDVLQEIGIRVGLLVLVVL